MRRPCLSECRMLRVDGFRRRRSWRGSALPPKADIADCDRHVSFAKSGHSALRQRLALFDHLVGRGQE